jgi:DNA polymerase-3 subunit gamma/tau
LTADAVRELVGAVPSEVLEKMMEAVERESSQEVLRQVDSLLTEGQNPQHFARQMVRFLRNALVARVAGADSPLLQVSSDEKERARRVAARFEEEDLTRFLQIMLRTHAELGYRQEQRFHLELGLLKLVHASRLLPVEQLLSEAGGQPTPAREASPSRASGRDSAAQSTTVTRPASGPSPFEVDLARKRQPAATDPPRPQIPKAQIATAPATAAAVAVDSAPTPAGEASLEDVRNGVLEVVQDSTGLLQEAEWELRGGELVIKLAASQMVAELALSAEARREAAHAASAAAGRALKLRLVGVGTGGERGGPVESAADARGRGSQPRPLSKHGGHGARERASQDPVVRRMQEKFGAEIRSVIDYKEKP